MRRSSPRALSSPRARSRRRWKTSGPREGSWVDCGFRIVDFGLGGEESAIRNRQSAITAAPAATKSRRCIVLAPPESAAYITRPPRSLEGGFPMQFEARIEPLTGKLPKVSYRWDPETDILSVACKGTGKTTGLNGTVDLEGGDGSTCRSWRGARTRGSRGCGSRRCRRSRTSRRLRDGGWGRLGRLGEVRGG